jgi:hypothetical protein
MYRALMLRHRLLGLIAATWLLGLTAAATPACKRRTIVLHLECLQDGNPLCDDPDAGTDEEDAGDDDAGDAEDAGDADAADDVGADN